MFYILSEICQTGMNISDKVGGRVTHADSSAFFFWSQYLHCAFAGLKYTQAIGYFLEEEGGLKENNRVSHRTCAWPCDQTKQWATCPLSF